MFLQHFTTLYYNLFLCSCPLWNCSLVQGTGSLLFWFCITRAWLVLFMQSLRLCGKTKRIHSHITIYMDALMTWKNLHLKWYFNFPFTVSFWRCYGILTRVLLYTIQKGISMYTSLMFKSKGQWYGFSTFFPAMNMFTSTIFIYSLRASMRWLFAIVHIWKYMYCLIKKDASTRFKSVRPLWQFEIMIFWNLFYNLTFFYPLVCTFIL